MAVAFTWQALTALWQSQKHACISNKWNRLSMTFMGFEEILWHVVLSECQCKCLFQRHILVPIDETIERCPPSWAWVRPLS